MSKLLNPYSKAHRQPVIDKTNAEWQTLKDKAIAYLEDAPGSVVEADVRKEDAAFDNDTLWRQMAGDLGLIEI